MKGRALGLDYGDARIGVALSDALWFTSRPLCTISRKNPIDHKESLASISQIVEENQVSVIILGYPMHMNNDISENCKKTIAFQKQLKKALPNIEVVLQDERLTSKMAHNILFEANIKAKDHKKHVDKMAAAILLQTYLDGQSTH